MAVIDIHTDPSGRTRVLFDFRACPRGRDDTARIAEAMAQSRGLPLGGCDDTARIAEAMAQSNGLPLGGPAAMAPVQAGVQAASARNTSRPVTLPSRRRISAS